MQEHDRGLHLCNVIASNEKFLMSSLVVSDGGQEVICTVDEIKNSVG